MKVLLRAIGVILVCLSAMGAYSVNYATLATIDEVESIQARIAQEKARIAYLQADWAYLNRPERLEELARIHFGDVKLVPLRPYHFGKIAEVAEPAPGDPMLAMLIDNAVNKVVGGGQ